MYCGLWVKDLDLSMIFLSLSLFYLSLISLSVEFFFYSFSSYVRGHFCLLLFFFSSFSPYNDSELILLLERIWIVSSFSCTFFFGTNLGGLFLLPSFSFSFFFSGQIWESYFFFFSFFGQVLPLLFLFFVSSSSKMNMGGFLLSFLLFFVVQGMNNQNPSLLWKWCSTTPKKTIRLRRKIRGLVKTWGVLINFLIWTIYGISTVQIFTTHLIPYMSTYHYIYI